jgi:HPt (histidine-containing phosphotransfer) domain-containing protein
MSAFDSDIVLDRKQLQEATMDDEELIREVLAALIEDTSRQAQLLAEAIREEDATKCGRLAHYSKGACASLGALAAASQLQNIETRAAAGDFAECGASLAALRHEISKLRLEVEVL